MPQFRQGSTSLTRLGGITPLAAARAGTVNDAGGYVVDIDCRGYKSVTVNVETGVVGTTVDFTLLDTTVSGGSYAEIKGADGVANGHIAQISVSASTAQLNHQVMPGRPWMALQLVTVGASTVAGVTLFGHGPLTTSRV